MFVFLHGETEWNREGRFQGRADSPLTAEGRAQAAAVATLLKSMRPPGGFRLVTSPLGRASATAQIVAAALGIGRMEKDDRLTEIDVGQCQGLTRSEGSARFPAELGTIHRHEWPFHAPRGESYEAIVARVGSWLAEQGAHDDLLVSTHGITSRILRGLYAGLSRAETIRGEIARGVVFRLADGKVEKLAPA